MNYQDRLALYRVAASDELQNALAKVMAADCPNVVCPTCAGIDARGWCYRCGHPCSRRVQLCPTCDRAVSQQASQPELPFP